jgi:hypothetical protein
VSATFDVAGPLGVPDEVPLGVSEGDGVLEAGGVLTETSGGTSGASSCPGPLHPASAATSNPGTTARRIRMMTRA